MNLNLIWLRCFGTTTLLGLNMGFWAATAAVVLGAVALNVIFWSLPPKKDRKEAPASAQKRGQKSAAGHGDTNGLHV